MVTASERLGGTAALFAATMSGVGAARFATEEEAGRFTALHRADWRPMRFDRRRPVRRLYFGVDIRPNPFLVLDGRDEAARIMEGLREEGFWSASRTIMATS